MPNADQWPRENGEPYEFLCQINLEALPKNVWNGLGPRQGWLSFFVSFEDRLNVAAVYNRQLGTQLGHLNGWKKENSEFYIFKENYAPFINPPVSWSLNRIEPKGKNPPLLQRQRNKYVNDYEFPIDDPRLEPLDWNQLNLLLESAVSSSLFKRTLYQKTIDEDKIKKQQPVNVQLNAIDQLIHRLTHLSAKYKNLSRDQMFSMDIWLSDPEVLAYLLENYGGDGYRFTTYGLRSLDRKLLTAIAKAKGYDSAEAKEVEAFYENQKNIIGEYHEKVPVWASENINDWIAFKSENHLIWTEYRQKIENLKRTRFEIAIRNFHALVIADETPDVMWQLCLGKVPQNWEMLIEKIETELSVQLVRREQIQGNDPEREKRVAQARIMVPKLSQFENYKNLFPFLEPDLQDYFNKKWLYWAEDATLQIGGVPRGWGYEFAENVKKNVMLIQIPSNSLTGYQFGDVSDLIVTISKADLKRGNFSKLKVDISN